MIERLICWWSGHRFAPTGAHYTCLRCQHTVDPHKAWP